MKSFNSIIVSKLVAQVRRRPGLIIALSLLALAELIAIGLNLFSPSLPANAAATPFVTVTPTTGNFGNVKIGSSSAPIVYTVSNTSFQAEFVTVNKTGSADFVINNTGVTNPCAIGNPTTLAPYTGSCGIRVIFTPATINPNITGQLTFANRPDPVFPAAINLTGSGYGTPTVSPATFNFGTFVAGSATSQTQTFTYLNNDQNNVTTFTPVGPFVTPSGTFTVDFSATTPPAGFGGTCTFSITFTPGAVAGNPSFTIPISAPPVPGSVPIQVSAVVTAPPPPPTTVVTGPGGNNSIGGLVTVDDQPAGGFGISLNGPDSKQGTTGADGRYNFTGLAGGTYTVLINYDHSKYSAVSQDKLTQTLTGNEVESGLNFRLKSLAAPTTVPPATSPPATTPPGISQGKVYTPTLSVKPVAASPGVQIEVSGAGWNPKGPDGGPNQVSIAADNKGLTGESALRGFEVGLNDPIAPLGLFQVNPDGTFKGQVVLPDLAPQSAFLVGTDRYNQKAQTAFKVEPSPACPNVQPGKFLRLATKTVQRNDKDFFLCIQVVAGEDGVNLNDTIILTLPSGVTVVQNQPGLGTATVSGNTVRWGGFSLAAQQSTTLLLTVTTPNGSLNGTSIFISGRFNRGQSFQQNITSLPPLIEIPELEAGQGGSQAPAPVIPNSAPSTGVGSATTSADKDPTPGWVLIGLIMLWLLTLGGLLVRHTRPRRR